MAFSTASAGLALVVAPRLIAGHEAGPLLDGDQQSQDALAGEVAAYIDDITEGATAGGNPPLEGEWALVAYQMAILGLGQVVLAHPEFRERYVPVMERAAERMMRPAQRDFATREWGSDGLSFLGGARGDAWVGWPDLALSMLRLVHPETPFSAANDRITAALARRLEHAPHALIETYPGRAFPTDVAACAAAVALHARAMHQVRPEMLSAWAQTYGARWIDRQSGYLWQQGDAQTGAHRDAPRGSGTAVAAYFLSFVDGDLSLRLTKALEQNERSFLGFGAIREYPRGQSGGGDIDSGPVILGVSVAATGFALGAARANHRHDLFLDTYRSAHLFGLPTSHGRGTRFAMGGAFGNALLLAQLTAVPSVTDP